MRLACWLTSSLVRHYPGSPPERSRQQTIEAARNEAFSFQVVLRSRVQQQVRVEAEGPSSWQVRVRRVGYVPVEHHNTPVLDDPAEVDGLGRIPGYVPDPLFDESSLLLPQQETHAFWISVRPPVDAAPGRHTLTVHVIPEAGRPVTLRQPVNLHGLVLGPRRDFDVTNWFYLDALIDWYRTDLFDRRLWLLADAYVRNLVTHGQNTLYIPVFTPPLDGVKRPSQLLIVRRLGRGRYAFDWRDVRRYVRLARLAGITRFEWCHLFTQWGARHAIRIYEGQGREERLLWPPEAAATSRTYRTFLAQFLPAFRKFLVSEGLLDRSFFHVSDEPHGDQMLRDYAAARALLAELAPWMKVMDAISELAFAGKGLTDMPVPSIRAARDFVVAGKPCWCYYCCGPRGRYLNRLLDTPLAKVAMHGFLLYRWPFRGFLHWGCNYWYESQTRNLIDPFSSQAGRRWPGWAYGDPFMIYPGTAGPLDSMRWEVFAESLQDYALLQTAAFDRDDSRLAAVRSFEDFPKDAAWRRRVKACLYRAGRPEDRC